MQFIQLASSLDPVKYVSQQVLQLWNSHFGQVIHNRFERLKFSTQMLQDIIILETFKKNSIFCLTKTLIEELFFTKYSKVDKNSNGKKYFTHII